MPEDGRQESRGFTAFAVTTVVGLFIDLVTKRISAEHLAPPEAAYQLIPGYLHFTAVQNRGAVFGMGQGMRWLFVAVSVVAIIFVFRLFLKSNRKWWMSITLGMLLAGILGNLYDRIVFGYVRDMIHAVPRWPNLFPWVFNVADSMLCVSIAILLITGIFGGDHEQPAKSD